MLAEARLNAIHWGIKILAEQVIGRNHTIKLELRPRATLEMARKLDHEDRNFIESAGQYHGVYTFSEKLEEKAEALIGLSQELINLGSLRQARLVLNRAPGLFNDLPEVQKLLLWAQIEGKKGWIEDYECGYGKQLKHFVNSRLILDGVPKDAWGIKEQELYSTAHHFSGRASLGLADNGISRAYNILNAMDFFQRARELDEKLKVPTVNEKVGHGYAWEARCQMRLSDHKQVSELIKKAGKCFKEHKMLFPDSGIMAHFDLLVGEYRYRRGELLLAEDSFTRAVKVWEGTKEPYKRGIAVAHIGIASCCLKNHDFSGAYENFIKAVKTQPHAVLKSALGS